MNWDDDDIPRMKRDRSLPIVLTKAEISAILDATPNLKHKAMIATMYSGGLAPPIDYDKVMRLVPCGKLLTVGTIREYFAKQSGADFTEPITAGIFVSIVAWASFQRVEDKTPYWRTLKANGELNSKYPGGVEAQKEMLEREGHIVIKKGRTNIKYYVKDYEKALFTL